MRWMTLAAVATAAAAVTLTSLAADAAPRPRAQAEGYEAYPGAPVVAQGAGRRAARTTRVVRTTRRTVTSGRAPARITVVRERSFLDPGTEVLPLSRSYVDYALPPTNTSYPSSYWDVANTFRFPLPGSTTELYPFHR